MRVYHISPAFTHLHEIMYYLNNLIPSRAEEMPTEMNFFLHILESGVSSMDIHIIACVVWVKNAKVSFANEYLLDNNII